MSPTITFANTESPTDKFQATWTTTRLHINHGHGLLQNIPVFMKTCSASQKDSFPTFLLEYLGLFQSLTMKAIRMAVSFISPNLRTK